MIIFPDILRGSTTTICLITLFFILSCPKYKTSVYIFILAFVAIIDTVICSFFYSSKNYTGVVYYSLIFLFILIILFKLLFADGLFQWLFHCITILNIYCIIVVTSYFLSGIFPYPMYAVTVIRIIMFALATFLFYKILRPLYREVSENWVAFLLPITGIMANYLYILLSLGEVESSMRVNLVYFCILTLVTVLTYFATILSLKQIKQKYLLREENLKRKANENLLKGEISSFEEFIKTAKQNRHDLHHHNSIVLEYLSQNNISGATAYLKQYNESIDCNGLTEFSKHHTVNAVLRLYSKKSAQNNIEFAARVENDIFPLSDINTGIVLSNLLENAFEACLKSSEQDRHIFFSSAIINQSLTIEIRNSVEDTVLMNNGLPVTTKQGGGTGILSVLSIINNKGGMLDFCQIGREFFSRIIIPLS